MEREDALPLPSGVTLDTILAPTEQRRDWRRLPKLIWQATTLVWHAGRLRFAVTSSLQFFVGLVAVLQVLLARQLLISVMSGKAPSGIVRELIPVLVGFIALYTVARVAGVVQNEQMELLAESVMNHARSEVLDVAGQVDLIAFEKASFYDRLQRAAHSAGARSIEIVQGLTIVFESAARILGVVIAIAILKPILLVPVIFAYAPLLYVVRRNSFETYQFYFGMTPLERQRDYMHMLLTDRDSAKDIRAFGLVEFFRGRFDSLSQNHMLQLRRVARRRIARQVVAGFGSTVLMAATVCLLVWFYVGGTMSLAAAGAAMAALLQLSGALSGIGSGSGGLYQSALFLEDYNEFMRLKPTSRMSQGRTNFDPGPFRGLSVRDVTFKYPGSSVPALVNVSLDIEVGQVVALVGENGSGKTTLAKLVAGLYGPDEGMILWDKFDTANCDPSLMRDQVTILFQDFIRYNLTGAENIGIGRHDRIEDISSIREAAQLADIVEPLDRLQQGFETVLGPPFFGGQDLSIGQWQRLALARAFFRNTPLIVLDEPTASLDARAEQQLFANVRQLFAGRAILLISHRMASVRLADCIYVLRSGRVAEHGNHESLMANNGLYAELFRLQSSAYVDAE